MHQATLICTGCPLGCPVTVQLEGSAIRSVSGHRCPTGSDYAHRELTCPTRIVTTTVCVTGGTLDLVSVKSAAPIPKSKLFDCIRALKALTLTAPVAIGDVILEDVCCTGVAVVATKNVPLR